MTVVTEDPTVLYVLLGFAAVVAFLYFTFSKRVVHLAGVPAAIGLAAVIFLVDYLIETDREQVERKVQELADAVDRADYDKLADLISPRFYTPVFTSKQNLVEQARRLLDPQARRKTHFWQFDTRQGSGGKTWIVEGNVSASGQYGGYDVQGWFGRIEFTFLKDPDGQWRVAKFTVTDSQGTEVNVRR
jgi:ketosteroid isomerase-like protein